MLLLTVVYYRAFGSGAGLNLGGDRPSGGLKKGAIATNFRKTVTVLDKSTGEFHLQ